MSREMQCQVTVPVRCLGQLPPTSVYVRLPSQHVVVLYLVRTPPPPGPAELQASTATGPQCCSLEEQRSSKEMVEMSLM